MGALNGKYRGILYMLLAATCFTFMGGFAKALRNDFNAPQLVFYRNLIGLLVLPISLWKYPLQQTGGKPFLLFFRGFMGTLALYTLMYCIIHIPLGTALTYNAINTLYISVLSYVLLKEKLQGIAWIAVLAGFAGVLFIYRPSGDIGWHYHAVGMAHGLFSAFAYLSIGALNKYYDTRTIVLSFLSSGLLLPLLMMGIGRVLQLPSDDFFFPAFRLPQGMEWALLIGLGVSALLGQYYVTKAYSNDKAGIIAAIGYSNVIFSIVLGVLMGDPMPDRWMIIGISIIISSGIILSLSKKKASDSA